MNQILLLLISAGVLGLYIYLLGKDFGIWERLRLSTRKYR